jgi:hypothetical protein
MVVGSAVIQLIRRGNVIRKTLVSALAVGIAGGASAQENWDWKVAPYLWSPGIKGDVQLGAIEREVDIKFSDIVDKLAGAVLLHVEAQRGDRQAIFGDLIFMQLEPEDEVATIGGVTEAQFNTTIFEAGYVHGGGDRLGIEFGVRYWDFELVLDPATLPEIERSRSWTDGFVGIRKEREIGDNWLWQSRINIGAGGSDSAFALQSTFARELSNGHSFIIGLKTLGINKEDIVGGIQYELDSLKFAGLTIGYQFD